MNKTWLTYGIKGPIRDKKANDLYCIILENTVSVWWNMKVHLVVMAFVFIKIENSKLISALDASQIFFQSSV